MHKDACNLVFLAFGNRSEERIKAMQQTPAEFDHNYGDVNEILNNSSNGFRVYLCYDKLIQWENKELKEGMHTKC
uniref:Uncharacterized protein n=1 Tax=Salix viminalis TaxID=40686 RepID=A0A6N2K6V1_SALVM